MWKKPRYTFPYPCNSHLLAHPNTLLATAAKNEGSHSSAIGNINSWATAILVQAAVYFAHL